MEAAAGRPKLRQAEPQFVRRVSNGGTFDPVRGQTQFLVDSVPAASPLAPAGVKPGDRVRYDEALGRWFDRVAGDRLTLKVTRDGASRRVEVDVPAAAALPRFLTATYAVGTAA